MFFLVLLSMVFVSLPPLPQWEGSCEKISFNCLPPVTTLEYFSNVGEMHGLADTIGRVSVKSRFRERCMENKWA